MNGSTLIAALIVGALSVTQQLQAQHRDRVAPEVLFDDTLFSSIDYGIVCPSGTAKRLPAPDTHLGFITQRDRTQQIEHTTQIIPLSKGIGFGVDAKLPTGVSIHDVEITVLHPPYHGTDVSDERWRSDLRARRSNLNFFLFEFPFEMVPGDWTMQANYQGKMLYSVSFKVVPPSQVTNLSSYCSGALLS
ncbi:MAG: DUF3859 domain-containing protein [Litoreibacter sp.]|uniref:DUF3859 domain-containing protein n=1 Tax=Litoreibacter sp. TaxID=1969459 RepID=UPI00329A6D6F